MDVMSACCKDEKVLCTDAHPTTCCIKSIETLLYLVPSVWHVYGEWLLPT